VFPPQRQQVLELWLDDGRSAPASSLRRSARPGLVYRSLFGGHLRGDGHDDEGSEVVVMNSGRFRRPNLRHYARITLLSNRDHDPQKLAPFVFLLQNVPTPFLAIGDDWSRLRATTTHNAKMDVESLKPNCAHMYIVPTF
jgi:hypothetical protein